MNSAVEIENAIRSLTAMEARAIAQWLRDYLAHEAGGQTVVPTVSAFDKWHGRGQLPIGKNTDDYLHLIRDGNGS